MTSSPVAPPALTPREPALPLHPSPFPCTISHHGSTRWGPRWSLQPHTTLDPMLRPRGPPSGPPSGPPKCPVPQKTHNLGPQQHFPPELLSQRKPKGKGRACSQGPTLKKKNKKHNKFLEVSRGFNSSWACCGHPEGGGDACWCLHRPRPLRISTSLQPSPSRKAGGRSWGSPAPPAACPHCCWGSSAPWPAAAGTGVPPGEPAKETHWGGQEEEAPLCLRPSSSSSSSLWARSPSNSGGSRTGALRVLFLGCERAAGKEGSTPSTLSCSTSTTSTSHCKPRCGPSRSGHRSGPASAPSRSLLRPRAPCPKAKGAQTAHGRAAGRVRLPAGLFLGATTTIFC